MMRSRDMVKAVGRGVVKQGEEKSVTIGKGMGMH